MELPNLIRYDGVLDFFSLFLYEQFWGIYSIPLLDVTFVIFLK